MSKITRIIFYWLVCSLFLSAKSAKFESESAHIIPHSSDGTFFGTIVFSNGKDTVAFKSNKAIMEILYSNKAPKEIKTQSLMLDYKLLTDMKSVPFSRNTEELIKPTENKFIFYANNKNYKSAIYFVNLASNKNPKLPKYFIYKE